MILAGTGHRPDKLGGWHPQTHGKLTAFAREEFRRIAPTRVVTGMAAGWDMALAQAALTERIPYDAVIPFLGQESTWAAEWQFMYRELLRCASSQYVVSVGGYAPYKMQARNKWMVDHSDQVLALWDGTSGGTANCVKYAMQVDKPIDYAWTRWVQFRA